MAESIDSFFLRPRQLLSASRIGVYDAINLVVYAKLPLITAFKGVNLIAGYVYRDESGAIKQSRSIHGQQELLGKYATYIDQLKFPVDPSHYEPLLDAMCRANECALPYFFHEHHLMVDRRRRAAMFARLYTELRDRVAKGEVQLQITDSEGTTLIVSDAWMTKSSVHDYLGLNRVLPWWEKEENLESHAHLERLLLSDSLTQPRVKSSGSEAGETQRLPDLPLRAGWTAPDLESQSLDHSDSGITNRLPLSEPGGMTGSAHVDQGLIQRILAAFSRAGNFQENKRHGIPEATKRIDPVNSEDARKPPAIEIEQNPASLQGTHGNQPNQDVETKRATAFFQVTEVSNRPHPEYESYDEMQLPSFLLAEKFLKQSRFVWITREISRAFPAKHEPLPTAVRIGDAVQHSEHPGELSPTTETSIGVEVISNDEHGGRFERHNEPTPVKVKQPVVGQSDAGTTMNNLQPEYKAGVDTAPVDVTGTTNMSKKEVAELLGVSENTVDNYRKKPDFPEPFFLSATALRWKRIEILEWTDSRPRTRS